MESLDTEQYVDLQRKEVNGGYIYFDSQGNEFNQGGLLLDKAKFESCFEKKANTTTNILHTNKVLIVQKLFQQNYTKLF